MSSIINDNLRTNSISSSQNQPPCQKWSNTFPNSAVLTCLGLLDTRQFCITKHQAPCCCCSRSTAGKTKQLGSTPKAWGCQFSEAPVFCKHFDYACAVPNICHKTAPRVCLLYWLQFSKQVFNLTMPKIYSQSEKLANSFWRTEFEFKQIPNFKLQL